MNAENFDVAALLRMSHSHLQNYIIPGVTSSLIGNPSPNGTIRLFRSEREHQEGVTPHSHRFDFMCCVLRGNVRNRVWRKSYSHDRAADWYRTTVLTYAGAPGKYTSAARGDDRWLYTDYAFAEGQCYSMRASEVHSIWFSRGAVVLFFEGPAVSDSSVYIEPVVDGQAIPTFEVKPWMFRAAPAQAGVE